jgi:hypothetical protein
VPHSGIFELQFIENEGMAFGWALPGNRQIGAHGFPLVAALGIGFYLKKLMLQGCTRDS